MQQTAKRLAGEAAPAEIGARVRTLIESVGFSAAVRTLKVSRESLARIASGLPVRRGTALLVEQALEAQRAVDASSRRTGRRK